jgi:hypothetical protein
MTASHHLRLRCAQLSNRVASVVLFSDLLQEQNQIIMEYQKLVAAQEEMLNVAQHAVPVQEDTQQ